MIDEDGIRYRWETVGRKLDERGRRMLAAAEASTARWGGLAAVSRITGLARSTINRGQDDLDAIPLAAGQVRRSGGGRKAVSAVDAGLIPELKRLVEPVTLGDPERPLLWVSKSMDKLAAALTALGHPISADTVAKELVKLGLLAPAQSQGGRGFTPSGPQCPVRTHQCARACGPSEGSTSHFGRHQEEGTDGNYKNAGSDYRPKGEPVRVKVHDFEDKELGKVAPYGVYDVTANTGFVSLGITADTAQFAVQSIRCWLERMGRGRYPHTPELTITADCGGSNGARVRLWKVELQKLAAA